MLADISAVEIAIINGPDVDHDALSSRHSGIIV